jgi:hypothetical protein
LRRSVRLDMGISRSAFRLPVSAASEGTVANREPEIENYSDARTFWIS